MWTSAKPTHTDLEQIRGDSAEISFTHTFGASGNVDEARFMIRERPDGDLLLALTLSGEAGQWDFTSSNAGIITILPTDTDGLPAGDWYYDIELIHTDGTITTFQRGRYYLRADIAADDAGDLPVVGIDVDRQGGSVTDWNTPGTNNYDVTRFKWQVGAASIAATSVTITFPEAFAEDPLVWVQPVGTVALMATVTNITTTQATLYAFDDEGNAPIGATSVLWEAMGR